MNLRDISRGLFAVAIAFALTGCFEIHQKLTVHENGDADLMLTVRIDEELAELDDDFNASEAECDGDFGLDEEDLPPTLSKTTTIRPDGEDVLCDVTISGPLDDMIPALEDYNELEDDNDFVLIQKLGGGQYALVGQYDFTDDGMDLDEDAGVFERSILQAVLAALGNAEITWEVDVPYVVETNGNTRADGAVVWGFTLADAVADAEVHTFEVIFETKPKAKFF